MKSLISFEQWETEQGLRIWFSNRPEIPMVDISLIFNAGSAHDETQYGLAHLTNVLLKYGTNSLNAEEISSGFESVGAQIAFDADRDTSYVNLRSLVTDKYLTKAIGLLHEMLLNCNFPEDKFLYNKKLILNVIKQQQQTPEIIARNALFKAIYQQHPYAHSILGNEQSIQNMNLEAIKQFYASFYSIRNASLIMVGDISRKKAAKIARLLCEHLPRGGRADSIPLAKPQSQKFRESIPFNASQTHIMMGQVGIRYTDPDYFPLLLGNAIFGGSSTSSRLFNTIRGKFGLAYHVSSGVKFLAGNGLNMIMLQTRNEAVSQALELTTLLLSDYIKNGPSSKELSVGKNRLINRFPLQLSKNEDLLNFLSLLSIYDLPEDFINQYCSRIKAVNTEQIKAAFEKYFSVEKMKIITVGDSSNRKIP